MKKMLILALVTLAVASCKQTEYVTVERVRIDTLREIRNIRDSIYLHDSIRIYERGDTIRIERWHTRYVESIKRDTIYQIRVDSVPAPYPVIKEVEKPLSKMQKTLMGTGIFSLMAIIIAIAWMVKRFLP